LGGEAATMLDDFLAKSLEVRGISTPEMPIKGF
jgi:hypothetical protein